MFSNKKRDQEIEDLQNASYRQQCNIENLFDKIDRLKEENTILSDAINLVFEALSDLDAHILSEALFLGARSEIKEADRYKALGGPHGNNFYYKAPKHRG